MEQKIGNQRYCRKCLTRDMSRICGCYAQLRAAAAKNIYPGKKW